MKQFTFVLCLALLICSVLFVGVSNAQDGSYSERRQFYSASRRGDREVRRIKRESLINQVENLLKDLKKLHLEEELADAMNLPNANCLRCLIENSPKVGQQPGLVGGSMRCLSVCQ